MPTFRVKAPDGSTYRVEAPEGATEEQAIEYVRSQQENQAPKNDLASTLAAIDSKTTQQPQDPRYDTTGSAAPSHAQHPKFGLAQFFGFPAEGLKNAISLLPETPRLGLMAAGRYDLA